MGISGDLRVAVAFWCTGGGSSLPQPIYRRSVAAAAVNSKYFRYRTLEVAGLIGLIYWALLLIPPAATREGGSLLLDVLLRSAVVTSVCGGGVLAWSVSEDIFLGIRSLWPLVRK